MAATYTYHERVLEALAGHGLKPLRTTPPTMVRETLSELYRYEIRKLRSDLLARKVPKQAYAGHVVELRKRYWLLSVPVALWTVEGRADAGL